MKLRAFLSLAMITAVLTGCAGGWRNGSPAGSNAIAAPAAAAAAPGKVKGSSKDAAKNASAATSSAVASDGARFVYKGEAKSVNVAGEFNAWNTSADALTKQADGSWLLVKKLDPGKYPYKFVIDGGTWKTDDLAAETADDGYGGKNSVVVVGGAAGAAEVALAPVKAAPAKAMAAATGAANAATGDGARFVYKGEAKSVNVAGEFNAWNTSADALTKQADGSWLLVKKLDPGKYAYKFVIDGGTWKADDNATETMDDGYGGKNSVVVVGDAAGAGTAAASVTVAPAKAAAAPAAAGGALAADGSVFTYKGTGNSVALAGDFNAWNTTADPLTKQADGSWKLIKHLPPGTHTYKFVVDGTNWKTDDNAKESADDGYGGKNSVITVTDGDEAGNHGVAISATATPGGNEGAAPVVTADGVRFTYAGAADQVNVAGDFNSWSTTSDALIKQADGNWTLTRKIAAGTYGYKFLINGKTWKQDESNPESKDDGFGGKNSLITIK